VINTSFFTNILKELEASGARLVAVSKTKPEADILELYAMGQRVFGENRVQELTPKYEALPKDIQWHMIGHLQTNKVKYIAPFVHLIESVDRIKLLKEINKQAQRAERVIPVLLEFKIAEEESKHGLQWEEIRSFLDSEEFQALENIRIDGVMGMATFTEDQEQVRREFKALSRIFRQLKEAFFKDAPHFKEISMGMSGDYKIALEEGSTMVRIGSSIFGPRG
jgi:pyridoxal phosphate enzyme (YggS family)